MKSKNVAFMGVALAFGLLAAFVTSKMYQTQANTEERISVIVAKQTIPVGTLLDDKNMDALLMRTDMPKDLVPQEAILDPEKLKGKKMVATKQTKTWFTPADISLAPDVICPPGYKRQAIKTSVAAAVSGFVTPGSHVDIWGTLTDLKESRIKVPVRVMKNALVLSVDEADRKEATGAKQQVNTMTIAVKEEHAVLLKLFEDNGLSLVLRDDRQTYDEKPDQFDVDPATLPGFRHTKAEEAKIEAPAVKYEKILIAKKTLKQNEKLTPENLDEYFGELDIAIGGDGKLPAEAVTNRSDLRNKFLTVDMLAGSWVLKNALSDTEVAKAPATEIPAGAVARAREQHKMLIYSGSKQVEVTYEKTDDGKWKIVEGAAAAEQPKPEKKDEKETPKAQPNAAGPGERVTINN